MGLEPVKNSRCSISTNFRGTTLANKLIMEYVTVKLELDSNLSDRSYMYSRSQPSLRIPRFPLVHLSSLRRFELNLELIAYAE